MSSLLKLDWATHDAARHAVTHWHYSRSLPCGKLDEKAPTVCPNCGHEFQARA